MSKVYIEGGWGGAYERLWKSFGWDVTRDVFDADVIQFTGGEDVGASLYDEVQHPQAGVNRERDQECLTLFDIGKQRGIPMAGICRGGQFLNVANGGKMFQHCDGHAIYGTHKATILDSGLEIDVSSTHHQIMRPNRKTGIVLMEAKHLGRFKEHMYLQDVDNTYPAGWYISRQNDADDIEAVFYPDTKSLCYQPHPEFFGVDHDCVKAYRKFLRQYLELDV